MQLMQTVISLFVCLFYILGKKEPQSRRVESSMTTLQSNFFTQQQSCVKTPEVAAAVANGIQTGS